MDLFKLMGTIVINGSEQARNDIAAVGDSAQSTADTIGRTNKNIDSSNSATNSSWSRMKSAMNDYKSQGMTTSQAWRQATLDMKSSTADAEGGMVGSFGKIGMAIGAVMTTTAIVGFGQNCLQAAADANAAESQFSQVFGNLEGKARTSLTGISDEAGISENRLKGSFTQIAAFAKTTGMDTESALGLSERAMIAVADSAAFYDRSIEDTTESLQSFLKGNYENDAALGLSCTETTRNAAANELYGKSFKDLSEDQKQLTLLKMVEDANKASGALGQAARESETWSNVTGNLKQSFKDFMAVLGSTALPAATKIITGLAGAVQGLTDKTKAAIEWAKEHETTMTVIGILLGTVAAAIAAYNIAINAATIATKLHTAVTTIATAVTTAFGSVMAFLTSPITLVVLAIGALIAIGVALYKNWDKVTEFCSKMGDKLKEVWENVKTVVSEKIEEIKTAISEKFNAAKEAVVNIFESVKSALSTAWETIKNVVTVGVMFIVEVIKAAFTLITLPFRMIWENCKDTIMSVWNSIKSAVTKALNVIKDTISKVWNAIVGVVSPILNRIKNSVTDAFNAIKTKASSIWNSVKTVITNAVNAVKTKVSSVFNSVKSTVSSIMDSVKSKISNVWNSVKSTVSNAVSNVKSKISSGLNGAKSTVTSVLNAIKSKFTSIFNAVKNTVSTAIDKIKSKFNFKWSLPKLKLPHPKISGEFSLNPPSVPKFSIDWYKKAMDKPMILNDPTIFGYNAATGKFLGGGEAGSEMVGGTNTIMGMISAAVEEKNEGLIYYLKKIIEILANFFPQVLEEMERPLCFDPNSAATAMAVPMDRALGKLSKRKDRGR